MTGLKTKAVMIPEGEPLDRSEFGRFGDLAFGYDEPEELWRETQLKWVAGIPEGPVGYFGVIDKRHLYRGFYTWFIPLKSLDSNPFDGIRACKYWLNRVMVKYNKDLWCYIDNSVPQCGKLVKLMGFKQKTWNFSHKGSIHYIYVKEA